MHAEIHEVTLDPLYWGYWTMNRPNLYPCCCCWCGGVVERECDGGF